MAFYANKFKQLLEQLPQLENQTVKKSGLGTAFTLTADPSTISNIYKDSGFTRSTVSRRMVSHSGAVDSMVSQPNDRAKIKRDEFVRYLNNSTYKKINDTAWERLNDSLVENQPIDIYEALRDALQKSSLEHLLGIAVTENLVDLLDSAGLREIYDSNLQENFTRLFILNYVPLPKFIKNWLSPRLCKYNTKFQAVVETIYTNAKGKPNSWFNRLLQLEQQGVLTHSEVLGEIRATFIGAHTLSTSLMWSVYLLATENQEHITKLPDINYARYTYMEALRLYPPFYMLSYEKTSRCPFHFGKETVVVSISQTHRSPHNWDNANGFDPMRFRKGMSQIKKGSYIPFGGGDRACPGAAMSMYIGPRILQSLFANYSITGFTMPVVKRRVELTPEDGQFIIQLRKKQQ